MAPLKFTVPSSCSSQTVDEVRTDGTTHTEPLAHLMSSVMAVTYLTVCVEKYAEEKLYFQTLFYTKIAMTFFRTRTVQCTMSEKV